MKLIYRAHVYTLTHAAQYLIQPRAINWRYQLFSGVELSPAIALAPVQSASPRVINWRYQVATT